MRGLIVVPAYCERESLPSLFERIERAGLPQEILVVDDGSTDATADWLRERGIPHVRHPFNLGYSAAIETGLLYAWRRGFDHVVFLDADGQHEPEAVPRLVAALEEGVSIAIGSRYLGGYGRQSPIRRVGSILFSHLTGLWGERIHDTSSGFKAMSRPAIELALRGDFADYHVEFLLFARRAGLSVREVEVPYLPRTRGRSMHGLASVFYYPLRMFLLLILNSRTAERHVP